MAIPISGTMFVTYVAISIVWATIQTPPSVVGIVISANTIGTITPPRVANMNTSTISASGTAIVSPRPRSWLYSGCVSWLMAGNPVTYTRVPGIEPTARRTFGVRSDALAFSNEVLSWTYCTVG